jgi:hypothetical protein
VGDWRTIAQLADRVGAYCWMERCLFTAMGRWAVEGGAEDGIGAEATVFLATAARRHGALAEQWRDRLPVRAGVDRASLMAPPPGPLAEALARVAAEPSPLARVGALADVVLPRVLDTYEAHLTSGRAVAEGPVLAVLEGARLEGSMEVAVGQSLVQRLKCSGALSREVQRMFGGVSGVLPGEWAS